MNGSRLGYPLALFLLALVGLAVVAGSALDRQPREVAAALRAYFAALERQDMERAMGYMAPTVRAETRDFVANQRGNDFEVDAVSVQAPSLLERLSGRPSTATSATVFVRINPGTPAGWSTISLVPLRRQDGAWYFERPPLEPAGSQ